MTTEEQLEALRVAMTPQEGGDGFTVRELGISMGRSVVTVRTHLAPLIASGEVTVTKKSVTDMAG